MAFVGVSDDYHYGLYLTDGESIDIVVNSETEIPGGHGTFRYFYNVYPSIHEGLVVFVGEGAPDQSGVYLWNGVDLTRIADQNKAIPGTWETFGRFDDESWKCADVRDGQVVFQNDGVYVDRGRGLETIADHAIRIPGNVFVPFNALGPPSIDKGVVSFGGCFFIEVFYLYFIYKPGIFVHDGDLFPRLDRVVWRSPLVLLDGRIVQMVYSGVESFYDGKIAFLAEFFDGTQGIYIAEPIDE